ncbi:hypothetical protein ACS0TY_031959 [Phlomoides rotata]
MPDQKMRRDFGWIFVWVFLVNSVFSVIANNITRTHPIRDGETIVSTGKKFAFGFFSPRGSDLRYVGIWYNKVKIQSVVWVANRERPILGNGGVVAIGDDGNLVIREGNGQVVWSSNVKVGESNSSAFLRDTGNLILSVGENSKLPLWQSFNFPTDTYLPDMEVHMDIDEGGEKRVFTSWRNVTDPSPGNYSMGVDPRGSPQIVIWEGANRRWRSGHWNGLSFIGVPEVRTVYLFGFKLTNEGNGRVYFTYTPSGDSDLVRFQISWEGIERQERWINDKNMWSVIQQHPVDVCDWYNHCGAFGKCSSMDEHSCSCVEGFVPTDSEQWRRGNWTGGCVRRTELRRCAVGNGLSMEDGKTDGFVEVQNVKLPDFVDYVGNEDIGECRKLCLRNCSCTAYAFVSGINCMMWSRELVDVRQFEEGGNALFVRVAHSELGDKNHVIKVVVIIAVIIATFLIGVAVWLLWHRKKNRRAVSLERNSTTKIGSSREFSRNFSAASERQQPNGTELAMFSFSSLVAATDNFSNANKLGQGGFGHVYKGILPDGQEVAVKRLSRKSGQGLQEFTNEIMLIAKLQHRNLVRLLGGCVQGDEKILLYEYMPNKSLDSYLFDPDKKALLDWSKRFNIIEGVARGLLYLHRDSRLRIIHRDLKASNILLDEEMNPKISDFGMARIFGGNQNEANTNIVVGTYGYMAPEYAMEGLFSLKSDVYSFGVLLLEIVTGRRNTGFRFTDYSNMIAYAWDLFDRGRAIELVDPSILPSGSRELQVLRCIHVGMLCVQDMAGHRPNMPSVVLMLDSENTMLPRPTQPTFTSMRHNIDEDRWSAHQDVISSNNVTISAILGR